MYEPCICKWIDIRISIRKCLCIRLCNCIYVAYL